MGILGKQLQAERWKPRISSCVQSVRILCVASGRLEIWLLRRLLHTYDTVWQYCSLSDISRVRILIRRMDLLRYFVCAV